MGYSLTQKPDGSFALHNNVSDVEVLNLGVDDSIDLTFTSPSTEAAVSIEPLTINTIMTGIGGVGGRVRSLLSTEVALGGWANALKGETDWGTSGRVTGLGSAVLAEMTMGPGTDQGTYAPLEIELNMPTTAVLGTSTGLIYASVNGVDASTFDTGGLFMTVAGLTAGATKALSLTSQTLKSKIGALTRYVPLSQTEDGIGFGTSGTPQITTFDGVKPFSLYTTTTSTDGGVNHEPFIVDTVLTGAGQVGGRARFNMSTEVALGGWANALKAHTDFGAAGRVTGLGSAIVAELTMGAGCTQGSYAPLEVELLMPDNAVTGTRTSLMTLNLSGTTAGVFDDNGYFFDLNGVTGSDALHMFDEVSEQAVNAQARLRVLINGTIWYIPLSDTAALS